MFRQRLKPPSLVLTVKSKSSFQSLAFRSLDESSRISTTESLVGSSSTETGYVSCPHDMVRVSWSKISCKYSPEKTAKWPNPKGFEPIGAGKETILYIIHGLPTPPKRPCESLDREVSHCSCANSLDSRPQWSWSWSCPWGLLAGCSGYDPAWNGGRGKRCWWLGHSVTPFFLFGFRLLHPFLVVLVSLLGSRNWHGIWEGMHDSSWLISYLCHSLQCCMIESARSIANSLHLSTTSRHKTVRWPFVCWFQYLSTHTWTHTNRLKSINPHYRRLASRPTNNGSCGQNNG